MIERVPPLARALGARLRSLIATVGDAEAVDRAMIAAVVALDAADRSYRNAIESALPAPGSREVLGTMSAYRRAVVQLRERAVIEIGTAFGAFDPLDTFVPPSQHGLSHAEGMRAANQADRARAELSALRTHANARIVDHLGTHAPDLVAARRERNRAFRGAIHAAIVPVLGASVPTLEAIVEPLATLAEGWY